MSDGVAFICMCGKPCMAMPCGTMFHELPACEAFMKDRPGDEYLREVREHYEKEGDPDVH